MAYISQGAQLFKRQTQNSQPAQPPKGDRLLLAPLVSVVIPGLL